MWFPHLPSDRILRRRLGRGWRAAARCAAPAERPPLVVTRHEANTRRIAACDEAAAALGLRPGLGLADARARHPGLEAVEAEPEADRRLLAALADWCDRYTPLVALDPPDGLFLDITGCAHLFGGEKALLDDALAHLFHQGFDARAGLASTAGAAWAGARFALPPIGRGEEAEALAPLPLAALRLDQAARRGLESVGLTTAGLVLAAPRAPLARRFGQDLLARLDQALGRVDEPVSPRRPVAPLSAERRLAEPVGRAEDIEQLTGRLAATLKDELERRGEGARRLELALFRVDGAVCRLAVGTARPLREPALVERLFRERIAALDGGLDTGCGFDLVRLSVCLAAPFRAAQADLAGDRGAGAESLARFAERVGARLGAAALMRPQAMESHWPERAVLRVPLVAALGKPAAAQRATQKTAQGAAPAARPDGMARPLRLFDRPEPVAVTAAVPDGPPARFRWRRVLYDVARAEGPERLAPEWWRSGEEAATRDYFRVEDAAGRRYWLFREGLYGTAGPAPRWFLHGLFA
ncbi:DNA polymerase Y family protein [Aquibium sp. A9E412]|uniref:Y-family DNA polymerase n=1 Tax=Aquibium sp. A9E412 TaxID=2976767 RepID=UPI0025B18BC3|nr:DNA polymerase Y family protein [Aquibium sp. A9E412]MDN2567405.1 DNA polymerase Y family protein [Aquibium sp. A9E412]